MAASWIGEVVAAAKEDPAWQQRFDNANIQERRQMLQMLEQRRWAEANTAICQKVQEQLTDAGVRAGQLAQQVFEWEDWALRTLYGDDYGNNPRYHNTGGPGDWRNWIVSRLDRAIAVKDEEIDRLRAENDHLRRQLSLANQQIEELNSEPTDRISSG